MRNQDGQRCDEHPFRIVKFRAVTTLPDGVRHRASEYGHRACGLHLPDLAIVKVELIASGAGPVITEYCAQDVQQCPPLLAVGEASSAITYDWGCRVTMVWHRQGEEHEFGIVKFVTIKIERVG